MEQGIRRKLLSEFLSSVSRTNRILWSEAGDILQLDITDAQRQTLFVIAEAENMHIGEIAERLGVTNGAVTQLVDGLSRLDIVERRPDPSDARKVCVHITELGRERLDLLGQAYLEKFETIFKDASTDQLETLLELQRMILVYGSRHSKVRV